MTMTNGEVARTFDSVADLLSIRGDQIHRILAYRRAAENIRVLAQDINEISAQGRLTEIPGIGDTLADKINEMLSTGRLAFFDRLAQEYPPSLAELLRVEGLGPKKVKQLYEALGIKDLAGLKEAAQQGKLRGLPGMGAKSEAKIVANVEALARHGDDRAPLGTALPIAQDILGVLAAMPGVVHSSIGGSLRRMCETIGDIDLLIAAEESEPIMERFCKLGMVESISARGPSKSSVILHNGLQVDLRVLPPERWGTLLNYFTGSQAHNIRLRELALKRGLSLNEHRFKPVDEGDELLCATEEEVYASLGLPYIPPPLREDRGEIEAAQRGGLPRLVQVGDIRADLHMHTEWSDGKLPVQQMAEAARARGLSFIAITDHSASLGIANGLSVERLREQAAEVRAAGEAMGADFHILHGTEMEIRADGTLDYPDEVLAELDFVIASLHVSLSQSREQVTERMLAALNNPHVDMVAHPSGRLIPDRMGADLDVERILEAAARTDTILEVNANPRRLDLRDSHVRRAMELGVKLSINTDAHHPAEFELLHYGVATAQRGWATAASVINTWPYEALIAHLKREG
jgi:DNA polymerase (family 10)